MQNKFKSFITANVISLIIFVLCMLLIFYSDITIGIVGSILWLVYTVLANKFILTKKKEKPMKDRLHDSNRKGLFNKEVAKLQTQYDSIKSREDYMMKSSSSMQDLYQKILEQAESNMDSATAYIESYDYFTRPDPTYLRKLVSDGDLLVQRFNTLVEKMVDIDTNPTTLDMKYVDDVTELLDELQEYRQVTTS